MNRRQLRQIMKDHLSITPEDNTDFNDISKPDWLQELHEEIVPTQKNNPIPRWAVSIASIIATFIFMITPPGQAVSSFLYNIDIQWNTENNKLEIKYDSDVEYAAYQELSDDLYTSKSYLSSDELLSSYPDLSILLNSKMDFSNASVEGDKESICIFSTYEFEGGAILIQQTIYYSDHAQGMAINLTENAIPLEVSFNYNSMTAIGGYEDGYANLASFDNNCELSFICTNLTQEQIIDFIESCYIE